MSQERDNVTAIIPEALLHAYVDVLLVPGKRAVVDYALTRDPVIQETIDDWRRQNAHIRLLATLDTPPPMPMAMQGAIYRLERRFRRWAALDCWRLVAAAMLVLGIGASWALAVGDPVGFQREIARDVPVGASVFTRNLGKPETNPCNKPAPDDPPLQFVPGVVRGSFR
jgi:anti-sigma factor RsiW